MKVIFTAFLMTCSFIAYSQVIVSGTVIDAETGEPLIGGTIIEKGTTNGTITDIDGRYQFSVPGSDAVLVFSFIGYKTVEQVVGNRSDISPQMETDIAELEALVIVGYGAQKEKDLTSAITTLKSEELLKTPSSTAMQALQGKVPGVQIVSSGAPGSGSTVRIRGVGTLEGESKPLYVVDGMFLDDIDFLNPGDIESISVLKDASAAAIYGVQAANGVILVETKRGSYNSAPTITYDGYYGIQRAQNILRPANTAQFVSYALATGSPADEAFINNAFQRYGRSRANTELPAVDTDWYDEVMESTSPIQSHTFTINGGNKTSRYSVGAGYFNQEGLVKEVKNSFERFNFRTKLDVVVKDWLDIGGNINLTKSEQHVAPEAVWFNSYFAVPIFPAFDETNTAAFPLQLGNAKLLGYRGRQNPLYNMYYSDDQNETFRALGNVYADVEFIPNKLNFKTTYNYTYNNLNVRNIDFRYHDGITIFSPELEKKTETTFRQNWDNILTYSESFGKHNITAMAGYTVWTRNLKELKIFADTLAISPSFDNEELWYFNDPAQEINTLESNSDGESFTGDDGEIFNGTSYLARIAYNYDDRYLLYGTVRRDGTNKFQEKWGTFPTLGAGWVVSEESFFDYGPVDFLKLRVSWGKLGNANVDASVGQPTYEIENLAIDDRLESGVVPIKQFDFLDRWETTVETNIGVSARLLNNRLSVEADYYVRDTEDAALTVILPLIRNNVRLNVGTFRNQGLEMALNWSDNLTSDLSYRVGGNFATLKNEVLYLGGQEYINHAQAEFRQRSTIGEPLEAFFGYEVEGIFQNEAQIAASGLDATFVSESNIELGDFIYKDQNSDNVIDDLDRVVLGSYLPSLTYGFSLGAAYKRFDLSIDCQGQAGYKILNRKRGEIIFTQDTNIDSELASNLWTGEGTSNKYPSAAGLRKGYNQAMSDYFVEDGSYFRIQNVRFTYDLNGLDVFGAAIPNARVYLTAERPLTVFNYNGFNPEVDNGIDRQVYPIPAVYTIGFNMTL